MKVQITNRLCYPLPIDPSGCIDRCCSHHTVRTNNFLIRCSTNVLDPKLTQFWSTCCVVCRDASQTAQHLGNFDDIQPGHEKQWTNKGQSARGCSILWLCCFWSLIWFLVPPCMKDSRKQIYIRLYEVNLSLPEETRKYERHQRRSIEGVSRDFRPMNNIRVSLLEWCTKLLLAPREKVDGWVSTCWKIVIMSFSHEQPFLWIVVPFD